MWPPPRASAQALRARDPSRQLLAAADSSTIKVEVCNRLGVDAVMELDFGNEL